MTEPGAGEATEQAEAAEDPEVRAEAARKALEGMSDEDLKKELEGEIAKVLQGEQTLAQVLGLTGENVYHIAEIGYKLLQEGNYDDAASIFKGLVRLNPQDPNLRMWLGSTYHRKGDVATAIRLYSEAITIDPENVTCLANRGELLIVEGLAEKGTKDLMKAIELDPEAKQPSTVRARAILATIAQKLKEQQGA